MKTQNKKDHLQAVMSRFVAKRDEEIAKINLLLECECSSVVDIVESLTKHFEQLAHAEKYIETVQKIFATESNKDFLKKIAQQKDDKNDKKD